MRRGYLEQHRRYSADEFVWYAVVLDRDLLDSYTSSRHRTEQKSLNLPSISNLVCPPQLFRERQRDKAPTRVPYAQETRVACPSAEGAMVKISVWLAHARSAYLLFWYVCPRRLRLAFGVPLYASAQVRPQKSCTATPVCTPLQYDAQPGHAPFSESA